MANRRYELSVRSTDQTSWLVFRYVPEGGAFAVMADFYADTDAEALETADSILLSDLRPPDVTRGRLREIGLGYERDVTAWTFHPFKT